MMLFKSTSISFFSSVVILLSLIILASVVTCQQSSINDRIYLSINSNAACFRLLNGTHAFGCSSSQNGNVGVVQLIGSQEELKWLSENATNGPYIAAMRLPMFTKNTIETFIGNPNIAGVLLLVNKSMPRYSSGFSHADTCPNRYSGLNSSCSDSAPWNPEGTGLMFKNWGFPTFLVDNETTILEIEKCFKEYNLPRDDSQNDRSLCALELNSHMFATVNARVCIRRSNLWLVSNAFSPIKYCDPVSGKNIIMPAKPLGAGNTVSNRSVIVLAARMDATSLFYGVAPGALSAVTSIVTLLQTANLLNQLLKPVNGTKNTDKAFLKNMPDGVSRGNENEGVSETRPNSKTNPADEMNEILNRRNNIGENGGMDEVNSIPRMNGIGGTNDIARAGVSNQSSQTNEVGSIGKTNDRAGKMDGVDGTSNDAERKPNSVSNEINENKGKRGFIDANKANKMNSGDNISKSEGSFSSLKDGTSSEKNVLFMLFNGETYDYIGSSRVLFDMKDKNFPNSVNYLLPEHIELFIELSQLSAEENLFYHYRNSTEANNKLINDFIATLKSSIKPTLKGTNEELDEDDDNNDFQGNQKREVMSGNQPLTKNLGITFDEVVGSSLPPASLQTFMKADSDLPGFVLTSDKKVFSNRYYESIFDDDINLNYTYMKGAKDIPEKSIQSLIASVSTALAYALYKHIMGEKSTLNLSVLPQQVDELLHCYLQNQSCSLWQNITGDSKSEAKPLSLYIGVDRQINAATTFTFLTLANFTGEKTKMDSKECSIAHNSAVDYNYYWMFEGSPNEVCMKTLVNLTPAVSPAFEISDYDWSSGQYSTWTESVWHEFSVRMFLQPSRKHDYFTFSSGVFVLIVSFVAIYRINSVAPLIFNTVQLSAAS